MLHCLHILSNNSRSRIEPVVTHSTPGPRVSVRIRSGSTFHVRYRFQQKGGDDGFCSARRGDQRDPRLVGDGRQRVARSARGRGVRQPGVRRRGAAEAPARRRCYHALRRTITHGEPLDLSVADAVAAAMKDWAVEHGATHYTHWFQPLTGITAEKHDSFLVAGRQRQGGRGVLRQGTDQGRARRVELPVGRHALHLRGARLHGVGSDEPAVAARTAAARSTLVIPTAFVSWTGETLDKKTPLLRSMEALSKQAVRVLKLFGSTAERVVTTCGPEQEYFLIDQLLLPVASRSDQRRPHALRRQAAEGPGARGSVLRRDSRSRDGVHVRRRDRAVQGRRAGEDAAQRSGAEPVRDRAGLRERQPRHRSPDDDDGDDAADGAEVRPRVPAAREAVCRRQRIGQAPQLVDERRRGAQPAQPGREHRTRTCSSWCSARRCSAR